MTSFLPYYKLWLLCDLYPTTLQSTFDHSSLYRIFRIIYQHNQLDLPDFYLIFTGLTFSLEVRHHISRLSIAITGQQTGTKGYRFFLRVDAGCALGTCWLHIAPNWELGHKLQGVTFMLNKLILINSVIKTSVIIIQYFVFKKSLWTRSGCIPSSLCMLSWCNRSEWLLQISLACSSKRFWNL